MDRFRVFHVFPVNSWSFPISCPFYRIERQLYCIELIFYIITGIYPSLLSVILLHEISQSVIWCSGSPPCCFLYPYHPSVKHMTWYTIFTQYTINEVLWRLSYISHRSVPSTFGTHLVCRFQLTFKYILVKLLLNLS